jgi:ATP-dependent RNA helicase RhlE
MIVLNDTTIEMNESATVNGFAALGISGQILATLEANGYTTPTPIQEQGDSCANRRPGCSGCRPDRLGQDRSFRAADPLARSSTLGDKRRHELHGRALILAPTRELAVQIDEVIRVFARHRARTCRPALVLGGVPRFSAGEEDRPRVSTS